MSVGIYKIENLINHKIYIGQSVRIEQRWYEHCTFKEGVIGAAISEEGEDNFDFQILEECSIDELNQKEIAYIKQYNSLIPNGYNVSSGGKANHEIFCFNSPEIVDAIREDLLNSDLSFKELSKKYNLSERAVYYINTGTYHHSDDYPYPIRPVQDLSKKDWTCVECGVKVSKGKTYCRSCAMKKYYANSTGNLLSREELKDLIRTTPFTKIGKMFGVSDNAVRKWCDKHNLPRKSSEIKKLTDDEWQKI